MIAAFAALGVFVAVPLTGRLLLGPLGLPIPKIAWPSLWIAAGMAIWTAPLLVSLVLGAYKPELIGIAGWLVAAVILVRWRHLRLSLPNLPRWDVVALLGVLTAGVIAAAFPDDPFVAHGDIAEYANTAVYIAKHGQLGVPYPWDLGSGIVDPLFGPLGHLYLTSPTMTPGFGHAFPLWLAQTWAVAGFDGLIRFNVVIGVLALLAVYGLAKRVAGDRIAAIAVLLLAFNPAQIWIVQQTLSEPLTQLFIWGALVLLSAYLTRGGAAIGTWAGVLFGVAAFVRIDALLLVPFLVTGHALHGLVGFPSPGQWRSWRSIYAAAIPVFVSALAYFVVFSQPYLLTLRVHVLAIGALTVLAIVFLGVCRSKHTRQWIWPRLQRGRFLSGVFVALFAVAFYGYFVRPLVTPFDTYADPLQSGAIVRTRIEEAIQNLGRYLTPGVVWGAFVGWAIALTSALRRPRMAWLLPLLTIGLGFTLVYGWNQSSVPYHFVAIRRFIPVVLPEIVVLCGLAASIGLRRLSRRGRQLALSLTTVLLVFFTAWIGVPTYAVAQRAGAYAAIRELSGYVSHDQPVLALGDSIDSGAWWLPLYETFDTPVTPIDITSPDGLAGAVDRLSAATPDDPVTILTAKGRSLAPVQGEITGEADFDDVQIDNYSVPVPRTSHVDRVELAAAKATGIDTIGAELVARPQWMVLLSGWYQERETGDAWVRGTSGSATVVVPIQGHVPDTLSITIADSGPSGGSLQVSINGVTLFDGIVPAGTWSRDLEIPAEARLALGEMGSINLDSDTFEADPDLGYPGPVGVEVASLMLKQKI